MKKRYSISGMTLKAMSGPVLLALSMVLVVLPLIVSGMTDGRSVMTSPVMKNNTVTLQVGESLGITLTNTLFNQQFRIQRTYPSDRSFTTVTSSGGDLVIPPITISTSGTQIITVTGSDRFIYSFVVDAQPGSRKPAPGAGNLFPNGDGPLNGPTTEYIPSLEGAGFANICTGGTVTVKIHNATSATYYLMQTNPSNPGTLQSLTGPGELTFVMNPTTNNGIWTLWSTDFSVNESFTVILHTQPTAPTLSKNPDVVAVCAGANVQADCSTSGSDGYNCSDVYEYRTHDGSSWSSWLSYSIACPTPGTGSAISTTGKTQVEIRASRRDSEGRSCYAENVYSWNVNPLPVPIISGNTPVCPNSAGNVYSTATGMTNYVWNVTGGTITGGGGSGDNSVTITWGATGTGHVMVNYTDANGCTATAQTDYPVTIIYPVHNSTASTDHLTLQDAINAATPGDVIELLCNHSEGLVTVNKQVTIDGNDNTLTSTSANWGMDLSAVGINIHDLVLQNAGTYGIQQGCDANNLVMTDVTVQNCGGTGISIYGSDNILLTDIKSFNNMGNGLDVTNCNNVVINGLTTSGNAFGGGFSAGIGLFTSHTYCLPAGINGFTLTGESIAEPTKVYSEKANAADVITGLSGNQLQWAVGYTGIYRYYYPDKTSCYAAVDAIFEPPYSLPNTAIYVVEIASEDFYVDDDPNGDNTPPMLIQTAVNLQAAGNNIRVEAGTFNETVALQKSMNFIGSGCNQTIWKGTALNSHSLNITRNNTTPVSVHAAISYISFETENSQSIRGNWSTSYAQALTLDIHDNCFKHINRHAGNDFALYVDGANQTPRGAQGAIRVYDNLFDVVTGGVLFENSRAVDVFDNQFNVTYEGVTFNYYSVTGILGDQLVQGNVFNHIPVDWAFAMNNWHGSGSYTILPSHINNNLITATNFYYAILYGIDASQSSAHNFYINDNSILSGSVLTWGDFSSQASIDASCNWWGNTSGNSIEARVSENVVFAPWLTDGTDNSGDPGFQPVPGSCNGTLVDIASATPDHILCGETTGSILVSWSGGTADYTVNWGGTPATGLAGSPYNITGLAAGSYTITVTDSYGTYDVIGPVDIQYLPVHNVTANTYHATIQNGIDNASTNDIIDVCAGTYAESLYIWVPGITLRGPNTGTDPNMGPRAPEAIINPIDWYGIYLDVANVTIDGFTIDGLGACDYGIYPYISDGAGNLRVANNIVKNHNYYGFVGWVPSGPPSSSNLITHNLFQSNGDRAIITLWNYYADVTYNVIQDSPVGIYAENANQPEATGDVIWEYNTISATRAGIWYNLAYGTATPLTIVNNVINYADDPSMLRWDGIWLTSLGGSVNPVIAGNTVTGSNPAKTLSGYNMWNNTTTAAGGITVQGGSVTNVDYGVWINNWDGYPTSTGSNAGRSKATLNGLNIANADLAGVYLKDNALNTSGATAYVSAVLENVTIATAATGILAQGADASFSFNGAAPQASISSVAKYIQLQSNTVDEPAGNVDATQVLFDGQYGSGMPLGDLFSTEDMIDHKIDWFDLGLVTVKANNDYVTVNSFVAPNVSPLIQRAVDAASGGWTVNVGPGTYGITGQTLINKSLHILGNLSPRPVLQALNDINNGTSGYYFLRVDNAVTANVDISNMVLDGNGYYVYGGMRYHTPHTGTVENCLFQGIKDTPSSYAGFGIVNYGSLTIQDNEFTGIGRVGMWIGGPGNTVTGNLYTGKGTGDWLDYGIELGMGGTADITANMITNCKGIASVDGSTSAGILVSTYYGAGTQADVENNFITGNSAGIVVGFDASDVSVVNAHNNDLSGNSSYGIVTTAPEVFASCNWWGTANGQNILAMTDGNIDYTPWLTDGTDDQPALKGFQPVAGSCNGTPVEITSVVPGTVICGETTGTLLVTWTGGVTTYTVDWGGTPAPGIAGSPYNITGLPFGGYTVSVTDIFGNTDSYGPVSIVAPPRYTISGTLKYHKPFATDIALNNVTLGLLNSSFAQIDSYIIPSGGGGAYNFDDLCPGTYYVTVLNNPRAAGGINSSDATNANYWSVNGGAIQQARFQAGDVSDDVLIYSGDALDMQNYFVYGIPFTRVNNTGTPWTYYKAGTLVNSNFNPGAGNISQDMDVTIVGANVVANLYALVVGDFNTSFNPVPGKEGASTTLTLNHDGAIKAEANSEIEVPVRIVNTSELTAISLIFNFPSELAEITDVTMKGNNGQLDWAVTGNELRIGWNGILGLPFAAGEKMITVKMRTTSAFTLGQSLRLTLAADPLNELAGADRNVIPDAVLGSDVVESATIGIPESKDKGSMRLANHPNPFRDQTTLTYTLPFSGRVTLEIADMVGHRVAVVVNDNQEAGDYSLRTDLNSLTPGVYTATLKLESSQGEMTRTIKVVRSR